MQYTSPQSVQQLKEPNYYLAVLALNWQATIKVTGSDTRSYFGIIKAVLYLLTRARAREREAVKIEIRKKETK